MNGFKRTASVASDRTIQAPCQAGAGKKSQLLEWLEPTARKFSRADSHSKFAIRLFVVRRTKSEHGD
jgi:hypothetical protein